MLTKYSDAELGLIPSYHSASAGTSGLRRYTPKTGNWAPRCTRLYQQWYVVEALQLIEDRSGRLFPGLQSSWLPAASSCLGGIWMVNSLLIWQLALITISNSRMSNIPTIPTSLGSHLWHRNMGPNNNSKLFARHCRSYCQLLPLQCNTDSRALGNGGWHIPLMLCKWLDSIVGAFVMARWLW